MDKYKVEIKLIGCDDETHINMEVNEVELGFIKRLSALSEEESDYACMPIMEFKIINTIKS